MSESSMKTAIVTAVITGIFTVLAGLGTYWITSKEPELSFTVAGGPSLPLTSGTKRIFVVEVRNTGRKEIQQTLVQLALPGGELSEVAFEVTPGVTVNEKKTEKQIDIRADLLNPGDTIKVSILTSLVSPDAEPRVVVRAPGVIAIDQSKKSSGFLSKEEPESFLILIVPAIAAVLATFLSLSRSTLARKLGFPSINTSMDQSEIAAYVCGSCELYDEADRLRFGGSEITYRGTADFLRHRARRSSATDSPRYALALKALLLNKEMSSSAFQPISDAIAEISGKSFSSSDFEEIRRNAVGEGNDPSKWRSTVEEYIQSHLTN